MCVYMWSYKVILSVAEHHSNIVPWQIVAEKTGAELRHVKLTEDTEELDMEVINVVLNGIHMKEMIENAQAKM